jgi:hypothetical protein
MNFTVASADDFDPYYDDNANVEKFHNNIISNSSNNNSMLEEVDSGIVVVTEGYHFTENNKEFSVQNIVRRPGCETFVIDFSDAGGGDHWRKHQPPPRRCRHGGLQRSQSALVPQMLDNRNIKTKVSNKRRKKEEATATTASRREPIRKEAARRGPIRKEEATRREPIRKEEKNEINKSLRNSRQG